MHPLVPIGNRAGQAIHGLSTALRRRGWRRGADLTSGDRKTRLVQKIGAKPSDMQHWTLAAHTINLGRDRGVIGARGAAGRYGSVRARDGFWIGHLLNLDHPQQIILGVMT